MGYDAYVKCNCYKTGKVKSQPPFPFEYDSYGNERILTDDCEKYINSEKCMEQSHANYEWMANACEHEGMNLIFTRVANVWGMSDFKWALEYLGRNYFPTLLEQLPVANGGSAAPEFAALMLKELEHFSILEHIAIGTYLLDTTTGETIYNYIEGSVVFGWYGTLGVNLGLDSDGFFIRKRQSADVDENMEIFRSKRFEQKLYLSVSEAENDAGYFEKSDEAKIELINLETNQRLVLAAGVSRIIPPLDRSGKIKSIYPRFLHVEKRSFGAERYADTLASLRELCEASVATGNPIMWC